MARNRVAATLRSTLFDSSSVICLSKARHLLLPMVAGAAFALGGTAFTPDALAAAGTCAPDANGTLAATGPTESCSGDFATGISYPGALGTGGNFEVDLNSVTNVTDGGVIVSGGGAVNVTVTQFAVAGNISNLTGNGIEATTFGGNIAITTVGGNVTASGIGIYGEQLLAAGSGSVTISVAGNIRGGVLGAGAGIVGQVQGDIGNVLITTADGTLGAGTVVSANGYTALVDSNVAIYASAPDGDANEIAGNVTVSLGNFTAVTLTNALNGAGISADTFGDTGNVNVTLGNGATITLNDGTGNDASGIYAVAQDGGNLITGNVAVTLNNSALNHTAITVSGDNNTAITARSEGSGSVIVNIGANNDFALTGDRSLGIYATGASTGSINVTTGAGSDITVNAGDGNVTPVYSRSVGIYGNSAGGNVTITTGGNVTVMGFSAIANPTIGIRGETIAGGNVSINAGGAVTSQWGDGIEGLSTDGNITITSVGPISAGTFGVWGASSGNGSVTIANSGNITQSVVGLRGQSTGGGVQIDNGGNIVAAADGIDAIGNGTLSVTNNAGNISATTIGINALSGPSAPVTVLMNMSTSIAGNVTSFNNPNITVTAGTYGISAQSLGGSNVLVSGTGRDLAGNGTTGDDGLAGNVTLAATPGNITVGVLAATGFSGNATVRLAAANGGNATVLANTRGTVTVSDADHTYGIAAQSVTAVGNATAIGNATVTLLDNTIAGSSVTVNALTAGNVTTGANNTGVAALAEGGSVAIATGNYNNITVVGDNSSAVVANTITGNVSVVTGLNSALTVSPNTSAANENAGNATGSFGIFAHAFAGNGSVIVTNNSTISVTNNSAGVTTGIDARNAGSGVVSITNDGGVTSNGGTAINALAATGAITISNNATIRGLGTSAGTAVVYVASGGSVSINNNASGVIASIGGLSSDFAIGTTTPGTGAVNVLNTSRITGAIDVSQAGAFAFNNSSSASWHTSGTSTFTNGYEAINNFGSGRIATRGATTFDFQGNAMVNTGNVSNPVLVPIIDDFINSATLVVGETSGPSSLTITKASGAGHPITMSNSGTIILGGQSTGLNTDGQTNDQLLAKGANMTFLASGSSRLKIDAFLGAGAEAQSTAGTGCGLTAAFADCMTIGASSVATGSTGTRVSINDTNSAGSGAINLPGTVIVDGTSGAAGDFFLSTADSNVVNTAQGLAIRKGFVLYQLVFDAANVDWDLVGMPAAETFELSKVTAGLQTVWHETADGWNERTSAIRHDFAADTMVRAWTIWGKAYYGQASRDSDNAIVAAGTPFTFDTTYTQSYGGIQFGADVSRRTANGAWALGGLIGYNKTRVEFDASSDSIDGTVVNIGAYGSFMAGPFFADLLVKDDFATLDFDLPAYAGVDNVDANSIGAELTFGGRFGRRIVFEPLGTLAYVKTAVGNLDSAGMNFNWEDGTSFRGIFALRLSGELGPEQTRLQPFILGGIGREFDGENNLLLTTGGSSLSIMDKPIETFGVASLGLNVLGTSGWSGFIRADGLFGPDYHSASIRVGMRIR